MAQALASKAMWFRPRRRKDVMWRRPCTPGEGKREEEESALLPLTPADAMGLVLYGQGIGPADVPLQGREESEERDASSPSPRRTQRVEFTCNVCGGRSRRVVNPKAMQHGTVIVQCAHCESLHKLVDHLQLFQEYNLIDPLQGIGFTLGKVEAGRDHAN